MTTTYLYDALYDVTRAHSVNERLNLFEHLEHQQLLSERQRTLLWPNGIDNSTTAPRTESPIRIPRMKASQRREHSSETDEQIFSVDGDDEDHESPLLDPVERRLLEQNTRHQQEMAHLHRQMHELANVMEGMKETNDQLLARLNAQQNAGLGNQPTMLGPARDEFNMPIIPEENNFLDMSMNEGTGTNVLIAPESLPTHETFVPGAQDNAKLLKFVRNAINNGQQLRIDNWPKKLKSSIANMYQLHRLQQKDMPSPDGKELPQSWRDMDPFQLLRWLEDLMDKEKQWGRKTDAYEMFVESILRDRIKIDWSYEGPPLTHPFFTEAGCLLQRWDEVKALMGHDPIFRDKDRTLGKTFARSVTHVNCNTKFATQVKAAISAAEIGKDSFVERVVATQEQVLQMMVNLQQTKAFYADKSAPRPKPQPTSTTQKKRRSEDGWNHAFGWEDKSSRSISSSSTSETKKQRTAENKRICKGCGWTLPANSNRCPRGEFGCRDDPRRNPTSEEWAKSKVGKAWIEAGFYRGLPKDRSIVLKNSAKHKKQWNGKVVCIAQLCESLSLTHELIDFDVCDSLQLPSKRKREKDNAPTLQGHLLLDSGAIGRCVVSKAFHRRLSKSPHTWSSRQVNNKLMTALNDNTLTNKEITFHIKLTSEHSKVPIVVPVSAIVAKINIDLVIDKATIRQSNLAYHFASHFAGGKLLKQIQSLPAPPEPMCNAKQPDNVDKSTWIEATRSKAQTKLNSSWLNMFHSEATRRRQTFFKQHQHTQVAVNLLTDDSSDSEGEAETESEHGDSIEHTTRLNTLASNYSLKPAFEREGSLTEIPDNKLESIPAEILTDIRDEAEYTSVKIEGPPLLQQRLKELVKENKGVFRATVQGQPARLTPFELNVNESEWFSRKNQTAARPMSQEKARNLKSLLQILLNHDIIESSVDGYYSHAFLVPKPNGKWRLVLDFKNLNAATTNQYLWPIPDIREMLHRVGESRSRFFAVFDLTSGYYQAPISEGSRKYTAFRAQNGIYRWKRLPMGLTGAGSYFQHSLATQVLRELLHNGVELYLDDCMVHADSIESFIDRLRSVFHRFRDADITLNPAKCVIGKSQVEYVGHTIDKDGLHFTRSKLDSVVNFPRPTMKKQVKSFLGLANYFRDHIRNHSNRVYPLQELVANYDKRHARQHVTWTKEAIAAFEDIREAIDNCPKLWFLDNHSPIYLQTDASDYGIGAYLYQIVSQEDGSSMEHPIGFISKAIANAHSNWDTPMKEGYAIFYALKKWEYLLRDRRFTILTDHQNLTRLRSDHYEANKMVKRWFMSFQEFDIIEWGYRPGEQNMVPDAFSRLCPTEIDEHPAVHLFQLTGEQFNPKHWDTIAKFHNSMERGHGGVNRTMDLLYKEGHMWEGMYKDVRRFINRCPCCQKMSQMKKIIHSYPFTTSSYGLWDTVSVDFIESLTADEYGHRHIVVMVDNFSRFTDLIPTKAINAEVAADALVSFCGRYATPLTFCTDSGSAFKSDLLRSTVERLGAEHHLTIAYSKEQNAIVERQNKEVLRHLRNIIFDKRVTNRWSKYLPIVQRIINTSVNTSTGLTPAEIVFPNGATIGRDLLTEANPLYISSYMRDMQAAQASIIEACERSLRKKDQDHMANCSEKRTIFENGAYVLVEHRHNSLRRGPKSKLLPFLKGPLRVKSHDHLGMYTLQDMVTQRFHQYHVSKLRHFVYDPNNMPPIASAVTDLPDEFVVQECLGIRGNPRGPKSNLEFKIRWAGYTPDDDTWEPWECVRDNASVINYLRNHANARVRRLVPKDYISPEDKPLEESEDLDPDQKS